MVRFSAYNTDSSNTSDGEDDHTSSREPSIVEPETDSSPQAKIAYNTDSSGTSDGDSEDEHTSSSSREPRATSIAEPEPDSSPPAKTRLNIPRNDPTIIPWAKHVGVDAQTMHVMQTSLFRMPEEAAALKALQQVPKPMTTVRLDISARNQTVNRKHSRDSDGDGLRIDSREVGPFY